MVVRRVVGRMLIVGLSLGLGADGRAQAPSAGDPAAAQPAPQQPPVEVDVSQLPISLDRIERQLSRPSTITLEVTRPMFRLEVIETRPKWLTDIEFLSKDEPRLPMPAGPAWHRDFLSMVTPPTARPFGQSTGWDLLQLLTTSFAQGVAGNALLGRLQQGMSKHRASEARAEVDAAIEAWKREREASGARTPASPAPDTAAPPKVPPGSSPPR